MMGKSAFFSEGTAGQMKSAPSFAKEDDSTLPKEPNGSIGLGPKPIWGMSVNVAITEPNHSPANQRMNSMPLKFEWEEEATGRVNKHHPVGGKISRQNFMDNFQKFINKQVNDQNPEYLKPQNEYSQEFRNGARKGFRRV